LRHSAQHPFGGLLGNLTVTGDGELVSADPVDGVVATFPYELKQRPLELATALSFLRSSVRFTSISLLLVD